MIYVVTGTHREFLSWRHRVQRLEDRAIFVANFGSGLSQMRGLPYGKCKHVELYGSQHYSPNVMRDIRVSVMLLNRPAL